MRWSALVVLAAPVVAVLASALATFAASAAPGAAAAGASGNPVVTSVTPIPQTPPSGVSPSLVIRGSGFGHRAPYAGDGDYIAVIDQTNPNGAWSAGCSGHLPCSYETDRGRDSVTLVVTKWTDTEVDIRGFDGKFGGNHVFVGGDVIDVYVLIPAKAEGPYGWPTGHLELTVGGSPAVPRVSVEQHPVTPAASPAPRSVTLSVTSTPHASIRVELTFANGHRLIHGPVRAASNGRLSYTFTVPVENQGRTRAVVVANGRSTSTWFAVPEVVVPLS